MEQVTYLRRIIKNGYICIHHDRYHTIAACSGTTVLVRMDLQNMDRAFVFDPDGETQLGLAIREPHERSDATMADPACVRELDGALASPESVAPCSPFVMRLSRLRKGGRI